MSRGSISLRLSITDLCQLRCDYCMPAEGVPKEPHENVLRFEDMVRFVRVAAARFGLAKVHLTGGEPLLKRGLPDLIRMLAAEDVPDLAMTTNAIGLADMADALVQAGLQRVNVSLDSLSAATFRDLTHGGTLADVLAGIEAARHAGLTPIKLNTVVIRGVNDHEIVDLARWALKHDCAIRFLELMPIGCARADYGGRFVSAAEIRARLEEVFELHPLPLNPGASSRNFEASDGAGLRGSIGFIAPQSAPFCSSCTRLRLTSTGCLLGCLARGEGPLVRDLLRSDAPDAEDALAEIIEKTLDAKCAHDGFGTERAMAAVGG